VMERGGDAVMGEGVETERQRNAPCVIRRCGLNLPRVQHFRFRRFFSVQGRIAYSCKAIRFKYYIAADQTDLSLSAGPYSAVLAYCHFRNYPVEVNFP
jgi:hypothetical protein